MINWEKLILWLGPIWDLWFHSLRLCVKQTRWTHMATIAETCCSIRLVLSWIIIYFSTERWPQTHLQDVQWAIWPRRRVMEYLCQMTWPLQSPDLNPVKMVWQGGPQNNSKRANFFVDYLINNVNNHENKGKPLNDKVLTFDCVHN